MSSASNLPRTFTTSGRYTDEQPAIGAVLSVRVTGSELVGRDAALKRAVEVRELIDELKQAGVGEEAVTLVDVRADAKRGVFLWSSTAQYDLEIEVVDLNRIVDVLVLVTAPKHAKLRQIAWQYAEDDDVDSWLAEAFAAARKRADVIANTLGVKIKCVHEIEYGINGLHKNKHQRMDFDDRLAHTIDSLTVDMSMDCSIDGTSSELQIERALGIGLYRSRQVGAYASVTFVIEGEAMAGEIEPADALMAWPFRQCEV